MEKICPLMTDKFRFVECVKQKCAWWNKFQECCSIAEKPSLVYTPTNACSQVELNSIPVTLEGVPQ